MLLSVTHDISVIFTMELIAITMAARSLSLCVFECITEIDFVSLHNTVVLWCYGILAWRQCGSHESINIWARHRARQSFGINCTINMTLAQKKSACNPYGISPLLFFVLRRADRLDTLKIALPTIQSGRTVGCCQAWSMIQKKREEKRCVRVRVCGHQPSENLLKFNIYVKRNGLPLNAEIDIRNRSFVAQNDKSLMSCGYG